jgi:hypothetical protein
LQSPIGLAYLFQSQQRSGHLVCLKSASMCRRRESTWRFHC